MSKKLITNDSYFHFWSTLLFSPIDYSKQHAGTTPDARSLILEEKDSLVRRVSVNVTRRSDVLSLTPTHGYHGDAPSPVSAPLVHDG